MARKPRINIPLTHYYLTLLTRWGKSKGLTVTEMATKVLTEAIDQALRSGEIALKRRKPPSQTKPAVELSSSETILKKLASGDKITGDEILFAAADLDLDPTELTETLKKKGGILNGV